MTASRKPPGSKPVYDGLGDQAHLASYDDEVVVSEKGIETIEVKFTTVITEFQVGPYDTAGPDAVIEAFRRIVDFGKDGVYKFPNLTGGKGTTTLVVENL